MRKTIIAIVVIVVGLVLLRTFGHLIDPIDDCLDGGGSWNYEEDVCEGL